MTSVDPPLTTTTLTANLSRLGLMYTADSLDDLIARATRARWSPTVLLDTLVQAELEARARRRLERQLQAARLGRFKPPRGLRMDLAEAAGPADRRPGLLARLHREGRECRLGRCPRARQDHADQKPAAPSGPRRPL